MKNDLRDLLWCRAPTSHSSNQERRRTIFSTYAMDNSRSDSCCSPRTAPELAIHILHTLVIISNHMEDSKTGFSDSYWQLTTVKETTTSRNRMCDMDHNDGNASILRRSCGCQEKISHLKRYPTLDELAIGLQAGKWRRKLRGFWPEATMEETYKQRKQREERERQFQRKKRLENARRVYLDFINDPKAFNLGVKYSMIDQMSEELAQYLDMVDCRRILTGMLEFVYDPSTRPEDPVDYFASLTKDRKIDKRELNKARRYLYQLMWKEYEIREEIEKLKTLLNLTSPRDYKPDGTERTEEEKAKYDLARRRYSSMQRDLLIRLNNV
ncbi:unnamed protein product [Nesidiocoris tenuis]|uniref:Uncharacterized protein n=1 Tax=Nesidiocoris tenuis TaxID=355587 RepID=A0A6H5FXC7_9HEMI|nr:unnamed protein product [Nesidiocoris tenuis]